MPVRNTTRQDRAAAYYHVFARGAYGQSIFLERDDFIHFQYLMGRYLSSYKASNMFGRPYPNYYGSLELLTYCLLPNEIQLLVYQKDEGQLAKLMSSLLTSYSRYFNIKYQRSGQLLQGRYRATLISDPAQLPQVSRYIHRKPEDWNDYPHSSLRYYFSEITSASARPARIEAGFKNKESYLAYMANDANYRATLRKLKPTLADH